MNIYIIKIKASLVLAVILSLTTISCKLKDNDGNTYKTIKINNREWMAENLNTSTFRNGDSIPEVKTDEEWDKAGKEGMPAWCYDPEIREKYGKLYNWHAVSDTRGLAPQGWHVPADDEWIQLIDFLGGGEVAGSKMKSIEDWTNNGNGTNETGFTGLPGGSRANNGLFNDSGPGTIGGWWSSTETYNNYAWIRYMSNADGRIYKDYYYKGFGFSVRCIKD
jgi:uncharacterized protein (TIGR02145 family)